MFSPSFQKHRKNGRHALRGMTLIEIMVVLVIIGMIAGLIGVNVFGQFNDAKIKAAQIQAKNYADIIDTYTLKHGKPPDKLETLVPNDIKQLQPDPWGNPYIYLQSGDNAEVISYGKDGKQGGGDDISSNAKIQ
jgi:general secretion pathway protein G